MAPLTPHWTQPSHPDVQEVVILNEAEFSTKSLSRVTLPPFAVFAKMAFPPCTIAEGGATYATVQIGPDRHLNLNSDLLYINHSCDPSLIFDTGNFNVLVGPKGLRPGDELTFFYPSTEWHMAQPFDCLCGASNCRGRISGASTMPAEHLAGAWLNGHIRALLDARATSSTAHSAALVPENGTAVPQVAPGNGAALSGVSLGGVEAEPSDPTARALRAVLAQAEGAAEAAREALRCYEARRDGVAVSVGIGAAKKAGMNGHGNGVEGGHQGIVHGQQDESDAVNTANGRRQASSREMAGEMGGDTGTMGTIGSAAGAAGAANGLVT